MASKLCLTYLQLFAHSNNKCSLVGLTTMAAFTWLREVAKRAEDNAKIWKWAAMFRWKW